MLFLILSLLSEFWGSVQVRPNWEIYIKSIKICKFIIWFSLFKSPKNVCIALNLICNTTVTIVTTAAQRLIMQDLKAKRRRTNQEINESLQVRPNLI